MVCDGFWYPTFYAKKFYNRKQKANIILQKRTEFDENYLKNLIFKHNTFFSEWDLKLFWRKESDTPLFCQIERKQMKKVIFRENRKLTLCCHRYHCSRWGTPDDYSWHRSRWIRSENLQFLINKYIFIWIKNRNRWTHSKNGNLNT